MTEAAPGAFVSPSPSKLARRGVQFLLLTIAAMAGLYARTVVSPLQETMRIALALSDNQIAFLQGPALALAPIVAAIPLGLIVDRYSRARLLLIFAVSEAVGTALTASASNFAMLFLARCLVGLTVAATDVAALSLLADLYAPVQRGRANMVVMVGQFGGIAAAFALGGALAEMSGPGPGGWRWAMLWLSAPLVPVIFLTLAIHEPPRSNRAIDNPSVRESFAELWRYRPLVAPLLAGLVMIEVAICAVLVWAAPALSRSFALPPTRVGAIMSVVFLVSGVVGSIAGGLLADLCQRAGGPRRTMSVLSGLALLSVSTDLFAVVARVDAASVLLVIFLMVVTGIIVMAVSLLTIIVPGELRGLCLAVMVGANTLFGAALAPVMVSTLSGAIGGLPMIGKALTLVCMAASLIAAVTFAFGRQSFPSRWCSDSTGTA